MNWLEKAPDKVLITLVVLIEIPWLVLGVHSVIRIIEFYRLY
jgi:hypothetical protein